MTDPIKVEINTVEFATEEDAERMREFVDAIEEQNTRLRNNNAILEACVRICHKMAHHDADELLQATLCFMVAKMDNEPYPQEASDELHAELARFDLWAQKAECKDRA